MGDGDGFIGDGVLGFDPCRASVDGVNNDGVYWPAALCRGLGHAPLLVGTV